MSEMRNSRSRAVSIFGLLLQTLATIGAFALGGLLQSAAAVELGFLLAGGTPIWLAALLVMRQRELAEVEALDLEELRREKRATGGGEALFGAEGGEALNLRIAQTRLDWMLSFLVPALGLITGAYLLGVGLWRGGLLQRALSKADHWFTGDVFPALRNVELGLVVLAIFMVVLFFFARYASGMGRVAEWQLLRACGSFMLTGALLAMALWVALGVMRWTGSDDWENVLTLIIPALMCVLGVECLLNFLLDRYRPRAPGTEPRAAFDSRLLGLFSEPGGVAHSLAEAINYQFGFRVSQTWFYQLLQRTLVPLVGAGALALWLLSCLVIVWPHERLIIERFGRQTNPDQPLPPGLYVKLPAPFDLARKYDVEQLQQFHVGFKHGDQPKATPRRPGPIAAEQWTDDKHDSTGQEHFDFLIAAPPAADRAAREPSPDSMPGEAPAPESRERSPAQITRMEALVQYRIDASRLADYTRSAVDPGAALRAIAWDQVTAFTAVTHIDALMGADRDKAGEALRARIARRADELKLGVEVMQVIIRNLHPEKSVSEAFRRVVTAQMEKVAEIRRARVSENELLTQAAGDRDRALRLGRAIEQLGRADSRLSLAENRLRQARPPVEGAGDEALAALHPLFQAETNARIESESTASRRDEIDLEFSLGIGGTLQQRETARSNADQAAARHQQALAALEQGLAPVRARLAASHPPEIVRALIDRAAARIELEHWNRELERGLIGLEGEAAVTLARAQSTRWDRELRAAAELIRVNNERDAYRASPRIYMERRYLQVLVNGLQNARKYFLAFDPTGRTLHIRYNTEDVARPDLGDMPVSRPGN